MFEASERERCTWNWYCENRNEWKAHIDVHRDFSPPSVESPATDWNDKLDHF